MVAVGREELNNQRFALEIIYIDLFAVDDILRHERRRRISDHLTALLCPFSLKVRDKSLFFHREKIIQHECDGVGNDGECIILRNPGYSLADWQPESPIDEHDANIEAFAGGRGAHIADHDETDTEYVCPFARDIVKRFDSETRVFAKLFG
jgi:hypothetical protein